MTSDPLTAEQYEVVHLDPTVKALVTAPAGTGKTRTLVDRLAYLTEAGGLNAGAEILLLTFTRSAARVLRDRAQVSGSTARFVRASTFDSFATRLLADEEPNGTWQTADYDSRIEAASELLKRPKAPERIGHIRHVLVDEVQDLVGVRTAFVEVLVGILDTGFTLFGDPAQAIFDFQLSEEDRSHSPQRLVDRVRLRYEGELREFTFTCNFRAESDDTKAVLPFGALLSAGDAHAPDARFKLQTLALRLPSADPICLSTKALTKKDDRLAILARTNGQVLLISRHLFDCGVAHSVQRLATERAVPSWIGLVLRDIPHQSIGKTAFQRRVDVVAAHYAGIPDRNTGWRLLKSIDTRRTEDLDLPTIATAIRSRHVPDEILDAQQPTLTVSTVHRAKGMEFANAIIAIPFPDLSIDSPAELAEETRVLYVALTRAGRGLFRMVAPDGAGLYCLDQDRWMVKQFRGKGLLLPTDFEIRGDDLHAADPIGLLPMRSGDVRALQDYLATEVKSGDPLEAELLTNSFGGPTEARYALLHRGKTVGLTSDRFSQTMYYALRPKFNKTWRVRWPDRMTGIRVDVVDTVAGTEVTSDRAGLGASGLWLRVRPFGLAHFHFVGSAA